MIKNHLIAGVAALFCSAALFAQSRPAYALVNVSVACVRENPGHSSELGSQQLLGYPVEIISKNSDGWSEVKTIDGYHGFIINNSLKPIDESEYARWRASNRVVFSALTEGKIFSDTLSASEPVSDIVPGAILASSGQFGAWHRVTLPDGRIGFVRDNDVTPIGEWASQEYDAEKILNFARASMGTPYLWGGTSVKGFDCSGLTWCAYLMNGRILPRNASAQARISENHISVDDALTPGCLLFFANKRGRINHVGVAESEECFIESAGRVRRSNVTDASKRGYVFAISLNDYPAVADSDVAKWLF